MLYTDLITEAEHGFHEGASIRKRNGIYYLVYADISRGRPTCLAYATSRSPLGPFTKGGIIIDNTGCDPETWNNHGSIAEFNGQWYIFYHRSSQASNFNRRVCVEPIHFNAGRQHRRGGDDHPGRQRPAARLPAHRGLAGLPAPRASAHRRRWPTESDPTVREHLTLIHHDDWAAYKYVDFDAQPVQTFQARAASLAYGGVIEIHLDQPDGELIGTCEVPHTGGWQKWSTFTCPIQGREGVRAVYLVFKGRGNRSVMPKFDPERLFDLESFWFVVG